jgi:P-type Cu+ transporter
MTSSTTNSIELDIGGMTCASCAARVERKLNRVDGVQATVNYATEKATIRFPDDVEIEHIIGVVEATGYTAQLPGDSREGETESGLRRRVVVSAILTVPIAALSMIPPLQFDGWQWLCLLLATPVVTWGAWPFYRAAWLNARHGVATMDTLIALGVSAAYGWSLYALFFGTAGAWDMRMEYHWLPHRGAGAGEIYLEVAAAVTLFILYGRYLEARAKSKAGRALEGLIELGAREVVVVRSGVEELVPIDELAVGDTFIVRPGDKIASDGIVVTGRSAVDTSVMTGESMPRDVGPGDAVIGATINLGGAVQVRATKVGADTQLAHMARLVAQAQAGKAPIQRLADRISRVFVPIVLVLSVLTLTAWLMLGAGPEFAFTAAIAVLIIACPCALGLATPTALLVGTGRGAQLGIIIKGPQILESTRQVDVIALDKTGTITTGRMTVADVHVGVGVSANAALALAAAVEINSEHPTARAITEAVQDPVTAGVDFQAEPGRGVRATVGDKRIAVGNLPWLVDELGNRMSPDLASRVRESSATLVGVAWSDEVQAVVEITDTVKPSSARAIAALRDLGLRPIMITGDHVEAAQGVAKQVGISDVVAGVLPDRKADVVRGLQGDGSVVAMVGDGVNDAPALAVADLGIAMGTGTDIAIETSDITVVRGDLMVVADAIRLSRRTLRVIKGNLFWAFAYNVAAIPLAMLGLLNPLIAGAAMASSSLFVVANSLRLRNFRPLGSGPSWADSDVS